MEGSMEGNEIESAIALLRERMKFLVNTAQSLGKRHADLVDATNPNKTWEEKNSQSWEAAIVEEIETEMSSIRREATFIGKAIGQLNHITRGVAKE